MFGQDAMLKANVGGDAVCHSEEQHGDWTFRMSKKPCDLCPFLSHAPNQLTLAQCLVDFDRPASAVVS